MPEVIMISAFFLSRLIRLASSKLNYFIAIGAIILYIDVIFSVIPSIDRIVVSVFCNLTPWLTAIGYSLCYGTILVKMARVYYIFNNPSAKKKVATCNNQETIVMLDSGLCVPYLQQPIYKDLPIIKRPKSRRLCFEPDLL